MAFVPTLPTDRLVLRPHQVSDFEACARMWADPAVTRYIGGVPSTPPQSWGRLLGYRGHWELMGFGYWAVEERATGRYVGELGFADFKRGLEPALDGLPELGWALVPEAHGKGYATEALRAAVAWRDAHLAAAQSFCIIHPENAASLRVAAKLGFIERNRAVFREAPVVVFTRSRRP